MTIPARFLIAAFCLVLATGARAQFVPMEDSNQIVVEGRRDLGSEIQELVDSLPHASTIGHISRFERSACLKIIGVPPEQGTLMVERIRKVGESAGIRIGKPGCQTNVLMIVTPDRRQLFEQLKARHAFIFGEMRNREVAALQNGPGSAALWHVRGMVDADGREYAPTSMEEVPVRQTSRKGSRITPSAHPDMAAAVLVVEQSALIGLSTTQLADYAAMRIFTGADPALLPDRRLPTILTILDAPADSEVPITLTPWDLALLKSLYASNPNIFAPGQRSEIRAKMRQELGEGEGDGGGR